MSAENNVPAIRFKGFSGEWASSELGKLLDITSASRVHKNEWTETGVPFFRTSDVVSIFKGQENKKAYISLELYKELSARSGSVKKGDLLITGGGSIGIPYLITTSEPIYFKDADLLWLKNTTDTNGYFLFTFFSSRPFRKYINSITHIGTISHYTIEQAKTTPIHASEESEEQTKIGNYFQQLDTLIAQHQQKHDKLLNLKKSLLEKMFPKQGATVPEIRFKGFSGEWEEKKLGELTEYKNGKGHEDKQKTLGKYELVNLNSISINGGLKPSGKFVDETGTTLDKNDLVMVLSDVAHGNLLGRVALIPVNNTYVLNQRVALLRPSADIFPLFILYNINAHQKYFKAQGAGMSQLNISRSSVEDFSSYIPEKKEQAKIGNFFKQLDTLLTQHKTQLKKLNNIKQACLEKMFV